MYTIDANVKYTLHHYLELCRESDYSQISFIESKFINKKVANVNNLHTFSISVYNYNGFLRDSRAEMFESI